MTPLSVLAVVLMILARPLLAAALIVGVYVVAVGVAEQIGWIRRDLARGR